ncbi:hypothetical protein DPMN_015117 [Dreissena polymorpha]|uniref:Uncharacterized protein n=1 Tax=Dreissena polymorpha TaxID=45954 RepID=A0A9D4NAZ3_DREPO|nr:hypothetical protein DPMN_015117 [Dreissena polymorpha]
MYENANKSRPGNEEILTHLFMAYVRLGHYKKQQQTAMALHKVQPQKNPYCFWAIMSIVMQVRPKKNMFVSGDPSNPTDFVSLPPTAIFLSIFFQRIEFYTIRTRFRSQMY